jgi:peptidase E
MAARKQQIIAIGGGGFYEDPTNLALEDYLLKQAEVALPSVCYIGTASGDDSTSVARFYSAFSRLECRPRDLLLFRRTPDLRSLLLSQDVIYVGGGNTKSMLAVWRDWGIDEVLREAWCEGVVLTGISAGAICWFESGLTDSWAERLNPLRCLGFLPDACCPHYDGEPERRPALHEAVTNGSLPATLALEDWTAAHFVGTELLRIVSSRQNAKGYRVERKGKTVVETALPAEMCL